MGSAESSTRRVSFGVDEEDRVRVLRGVKLTEDVLQRMRGVANMAPSPAPPPTAPAAGGSQPDPASKPREPGPTGRPSPKPAPRPPPAAQPAAPQAPTPPPAARPPSPKTSRTAGPKTATNANANASASAAEEQQRYKRQQQIMSEELAKVAKKERESAREEMSAGLRGERLLASQEREKAQTLAKRLQKKDADLKVMDAFYKEQLDLLEKRNMERFRQSSEQFNQAATSCEANVRPRGTEPVCSGLQAHVLRCYRDNHLEPLRCSELAKQYQQCISTAKTNLMVNHG